MNLKLKKNKKKGKNINFFNSFKLILGFEPIIFSFVLIISFNFINFLYETALKSPL